MELDRMTRGIAVLLSSYNGENFIVQQLQSILSQKTDYPFTIFVRDDGSKDSTLHILNEFKVHHKNIVVIAGKNKGYVASFFELLKISYSQGYDWFAFSDQDDYWLPNKLQDAVKKIKKYDYEPVLYGSKSLITDDKLISTGKTTQIKKRNIKFYNTAIQNILPGHGQVINKKLAEVILKYTGSTKLIYSQDLWISTVASVTGKVIFDDQPHTLYRMHSNNQLGYGKGKIQWITDHINRLKQQESNKIAKQLKYFVKCYFSFLSLEEKEEMKKFFNSQHTLMNRIIYAIHTRLYRQKQSETQIFKLLYILGFYNL